MLLLLSLTLCTRLHLTLQRLMEIQRLFNTLRARMLIRGRNGSWLLQRCGERYEKKNGKRMYLVPEMLQYLRRRKRCQDNVLHVMEQGKHFTPLVRAGEKTFAIHVKVVANLVLATRKRAHHVDLDTADTVEPRDTRNVFLAVEPVSLDANTVMELDVCSLPLYQLHKHRAAL